MAAAVQKGILSESKMIKSHYFFKIGPMRHLGARRQVKVTFLNTSG